MLNQTATYTTYILAPRVKIWKALTDGAITRKFFFGRRIESDFKEQSPWTMWMPDPFSDDPKAPEIVDSEGTILEVQPGRKLVKTWRVVWVPDMHNLPQGQVTYTLDEIGLGVTRLTLLQQHDGPMPDHYVEMGRKGWAAILSGLKTLLETGRPMPPIDMAQ